MNNRFDAALFQGREEYFVKEPLEVIVENERIVFPAKMCVSQ
jgi:hypothetical protein